MRFPYKGDWHKRKLNEICLFFKGNGLSKSDLSNEGFPCILYGELYTTYKNEVISDIASKTTTTLLNPFLSKNNDLIIPGSGEDPIDIAVARAIYQNDIILGGDLNVLRPKSNVSAAFLSYQLNGVRRYDIAKKAQGKSIVHLHNSDLKEVYVSIPTYDEQLHIVKLLTKIDEMIETQSKIINDLKAQKNYIIHSIFSKLNSKLVLITDIAEIYQPQTISSANFDESAEFPVFGANGIIGYYEKYNHENEQICIACRGASVGTINLSKKKSWITGNSMVINSDNYDDIIDKKFLYYQLMFIDFNKYISGSGQPQITRESLKNLKIKVPSLEAQQLISNILNHIDLKITIELKLLCQYQLQKAFLLKNMFV